MKVNNLKKERNSLKIEREKLHRRKDLKSEDKSLKRKETSCRLTSLNSDIEKLYKKYNEIKKERITKEKSQQILINRLNYLKNEVKRSVSKKENKPTSIKKEKENKKIFVKINSKYKFNRVVKRYKLPEKKNSHNNELYKDNESLGKTSFNGNESQIIISGTYKSFANSKKKGNNSSNINLSNEKEKENNNGHNDLSKNNLNNIEKDLLRKYKCNIGNKNSNNNIYIIINNPNNNFFKEKSLNLENKNKIYYEDFTPKNNINHLNNSKCEKNNHTKNNSCNDIVDFGEEREIILMKANGKKLQDIINSINNLNNLKTNKNESKSIIFENNNEKNEKEKDNDKVNNNIKDKDNISFNSININENQKIEKKDSFIRPNFLNLYENDDNSAMKQKVDINSFGETNRTPNAIEIIKDNKNIFEDEKKELNKENNYSNNSNSKNKMSHPFSSGISTISNGSSGVKQINSKKQIADGDKNVCLLNEIKKFDDTTNNNLILNNTISVDNFDYFKLYSSNNTTDKKEKNSTINNDHHHTKEFCIKESTDNNYYLLNKKNKLLMKDIKKNNIKNNIKKIGNDCINYSLSYKNLNNSYRNKDITKIRTNSTKWNLDLEKIKKNNLRKDSYYTSIEKKRKALGLEFKSNYNRELSIQTEKVIKKKVLGKRKNNILINDNSHCVKSINIYENLINKDKKEKLIKVRKRDGNKIEDRFNFENKNFNNESFHHKIKKNKTSTNFNYTKKNLIHQNSKKQGLNENILRNKNIKKNSNNIFFLDKNDILINKTSDSCFYSLVNKIINGA